LLTSPGRGAPGARLPAAAAALRCRGVLEVREQCRTLAEKCEPGVLKAMPLDDLLQLLDGED